MRLHWFAVGAVAVLGCESLRVTAPEPDHAPVRVVAKQPEVTPVAAAEPPIASVEPDPLTLAAESLERGDGAGAAVHLEAYVCRHPDQLMFRAQLAELLVRAGRDAPAKAHYERFVADAQRATGAPRNHLVTAHTRLMEIAQRADDRFAEAFHRGVGLLLLSKEQEKLADGDPAFGEEMLCKAIKALAEARELNPSDARARVYLAEAYERSGNARAAEAERAAARNALVPGQLTSAERGRVMLVEPVTASSAR
jgi:thioredoxin-like negative regulator of GroEL